jgi:hypothetical protein
VAVPVMRNPFIKQPSEISDRAVPDNGAEVDFSVLELGEAHRFGARLFDEAPDLEQFCHDEISRWTRQWVGNSGTMELLLDEPIELVDGPGVGRVYLVEAASLLFGSTGGATPRRENALIGVIVVAVPQAQRVLYAVSQFDMPNRGGHYTLETENGRKRLAQQQMQRMWSLAETLQLP